MMARCSLSVKRPLRPLLPLGGSASSLRAALAGIERLFGEPGAGDARANLLECGVPRRRSIIGERREPAVIRRAETFDRNDIGGLEHPGAHLFRRLDA